MQKTLSIIIPTYNMEKYVSRCIDSICKTDNINDIQVIAVNDGSKDGSLGILRDFAQRFPDSVEVIDKPNGNYGSCINAALPIAKGKYVKVVDADDWVETAELARYVDHLKETTADASMTSFKQVYVNGKENDWLNAKGEPARTKSADEFFSYTENLTLPMHRIAYRTALLLEMGYKQSEGISYTDSEWVYKPMLKAKTVDVSEHNVYRYMLGREGQTMDPKVMLRSMGQEIIIMRSLLPFRLEVVNVLSKNVRTFADFVICRKALLVYTQMLIVAPDELFDPQILNDLEDAMKEFAPDLYERMATYDARCVVVRHWRKSGKRYNTLIRKAIHSAIELYKHLKG